MSALLILSTLTLLPTTHADEKSPISILYYEPIQLIDTEIPGNNTTTLATVDDYEQIIFDAFGRRFALQPVASRFALYA